MKKAIALLVYLAIPQLMHCNSQKLKSSNRTSRGPQAGAEANPKVIETDNNGVLTLGDTKFGPFLDKKVTARVDYLNQEIEKTLNFREGTAKINLPNVQLGEKASISISFLVDDTVVLIAEKPNLEFSKNKQSRKLADCRIRTPEWDGTQSRGNCNWEIRTLN